MKAKRISWVPVTGTTSNIAGSQTPGAAGNLTLAGALCSGGVLPKQTLAYAIGITSAGDESGRTFTITGTNADGAALVEAVTGANAGLALSTGYFRSISSIAVDAATAGAVIVGTSNATRSALSPTFPVDMDRYTTELAADVSGTINFTLQKCYERPTAGETPNWLTAQAAGAIDVQTAITNPIGAVRVLFTSYTNGATLALSILQTVD